MIAKYITVLSLTLLLHFRSIAQPDGKFEQWGQVTLAELKMTECSFEKDADALLLLDLAEVFYRDEGNFYAGNEFKITSAYYQRYKIFTPAGKGKANFRLEYYPLNKKNISNVKANCYNLRNGQIVKTPLQEKDIHFTAKSSNMSVVSFTVPEVEEGSVFEVAYDRNESVNYTLPNWYFQTDIPCLESTIKVGFLDAFEYVTRKRVSTGYQEKSERYVSHLKVNVEPFPETLAGKMITYSEFNRPSVRPEPMMNSPRNYRDFVAFQLRNVHYPFETKEGFISSWSKFNEYLIDNSYFGQHFNGPGIPRKTIKDLLINSGLETASSDERAKAIFEFVRHKAAWNGGEGIWASKENADVWQDRTGNRADVNLLLLNTLLQEGITAYPMITGVRDYVKINTQYPLLDNMGSVVVVLEHKNKKLVLDATNKFLPFGMAPYEILNTEGYIVRNRDEGSWYSMYNEASDNKTMQIKATLDRTGLITGQTNVRYNNYQQAWYRQLKATESADSMAALIKKQMPGVTVVNFTDSVDELNSIYSQKINFTIAAVKGNLDKVSFTAEGLYAGAEKIFVSKDRISDVDLGYKSKNSVVLQLEIPDEYELDSMPAQTLLQTADTSITLSFNVEQVGTSVFMRQKLEYRKSFYPLQDYNSFYDFHQKYYTIIQQPLVLRRKK